MTAGAYKKKEPTTYYIQEIHFKRKDTERLKGHGDRHTMLILKESWSSYANFKHSRFQSKENYHR